MGRGTSVKWPVGLGGKGNEGVAGPGEERARRARVRRARLRGHRTSCRRHASRTRRASSSSRPSRAPPRRPPRRPRACRPTSGCRSPTRRATDAYPIASFTWLLVYKDQPNEAKGKALAKFLWWAIHDGQRHPAALLYAPLPAPVVKEIEADAQADHLFRQADAGGQVAWRSTRSLATGTRPPAVPAAARGQPGPPRPRRSPLPSADPGLGVAVLDPGGGAGRRRCRWESWPAIRAFGLRFLVTSHWDPVAASSARCRSSTARWSRRSLALLIAVPLVARRGDLPRRAGAAPGSAPPVAFLIEMLAAMPSVVYGLWGIFVLVPLLRESRASRRSASTWLPAALPGAALGIGMLAAGLILAIMVAAPHHRRSSREVLLRRARARSARPRSALGRHPLGDHPHRGAAATAAPASSAPSSSGSGRALGETMAVTMVIGNRPEIAASLFAPGYTMAERASPTSSPRPPATLTSRALVGSAWCCSSSRSRERASPGCWSGAWPRQPARGGRAMTHRAAPRWSAPP